MICRGRANGLYNYTARDRCGYAHYSQRVRREHAQYVRRSLRERRHSLIFVSHTPMFVTLSLPVRYELVLGSFQIRYQFVKSCFDGHIRRGFQRTCAYPRFISFLQYGSGTSAQYVIV